MQIQIINPIEYPGWDDLLLTLGDYSFFHSAGWARVISESYRYKPLYFISIDNGKPISLIPLMAVNSFLTGKRGVSLPFTDYCNPISTDDEGFYKILDHVKKYGKNAGWKFIEFRGGGDWFKDTPHFSSCLIHNLDLTSDHKQILSGFKSNTKRNIKKAAKEGVGVQLYNSLESVKEFYRLNCMTRKDHGLPPQSYRFFENIYKYIISSKKGFVALASYLDRNIAGAVYFHTGDSAVYKYGASDRRYQHLRPNNLIMWEAIKWYSENGYRRFCFGRTEVEHKGLLQFKRGWGCKEETVYYYRYNFQKDTFIQGDSFSKVPNNFFRKLPLPVLKIIGAILYRHVG